MLLNSEFFRRIYGPTFPNLGWFPSLAYLLRRAVVVPLLMHKPRGAVIEFGSASGALLVELAEAGFDCTGVESSVRALELAHRVTADIPEIKLLSAPPENGEVFDYVIALEVLEHIENDASVLTSWRTLLKQNGKLILSVPAHRKRWGAADVYWGHFRRYDRDDLTRLFAAAGLTIEAIYCWGFPLKNLSQVFENRHFQKKLDRAGSDEKTIDKAAATAASGVERKSQVRWRKLFSNPLIVGLFLIIRNLQRRTLRTDLGTGYIVVARSANA